MKSFRILLLFVIIPFVCTPQVSAQDQTYIELDLQVQSCISKSEWFCVLDLAKAQIRVDVDRAEGYYHSALAFYNLGKNKMAQPYMSHLRKMDLGGLESKVKELNSKLNAGKNPKIKETFFLNYDAKKGVRLYDRTFIAATYDTNLPFGLGIGSINHHGIATYLQLRAKSEIFTKAGEITVRSNGNIYGAQGLDAQATGTIRQGSAEIVMGVTWKIHQPIWMYVGGGLNHSREFWEVKLFEENGSNLGQLWARNSEVNLNQAVLESGFIMDFKGLNLRGGTSLVGFDFSKLRYHLGIGISFKKK
jgi:hypothetical protein